MTDRVSNALVEKVIQDLYKIKELTEEYILLLYSIFHDSLFEALDMLESKSVRRISSKSGRTLFRVSDAGPHPNNSNGNVSEEQCFSCFISPHHCNCPTFLTQVIVEEKICLCKHVLATILGDILNTYEKEELDDEVFAENYYIWML